MKRGRPRIYKDSTARVRAYRAKQKQAEKVEPTQYTGDVTKFAHCGVCGRETKQQRIPGVPVYHKECVE